MKSVIRRAASGACLAEAAVGVIFLIPLLFTLLDVTTLIIAQTQNDAIAKHSARAAAGMATRMARQTTAGMVVANYQGNAISTAPSLQSYAENPPGQNVTVVTKITCHLPVPVPFGGPAEQTFSATETEPIVALLAPSAAPVGLIASASTGGWGQNDDTGYLKVVLPCGPDGGGTPLVTAPVIGAPLSGIGGGLGGRLGGGGGGGGREIRPD
jgi:hypothetical protein